MGNGLSVPLSDQIHYGAAAEYPFSPKRGGLVKLLGCAPRDFPDRSEFAVTTGFSFQITRDLQFHASLTKGINSRVLDVSGTAGIVWSFPALGGRAAQ